MKLIFFHDIYSSKQTQTIFYSNKVKQYLQHQLMIKVKYLIVFQEKMKAYFKDKALLFDHSQTIKKLQQNLDISEVLTADKELLPQEYHSALQKVLTHQQFSKIYQKHKAMLQMIESPLFQDFLLMMKQAGNQIFQNNQELRKIKLEEKKERAQLIGKKEMELRQLLKQINIKYDLSQLIKAIIAEKGQGQELQRLGNLIVENQYRSMKNILKSQQVQQIRANLQKSQAIELKDRQAEVLSNLLIQKEETNKKLIDENETLRKGKTYKFTQEQLTQQFKSNDLEIIVLRLMLIPQNLKNNMASISLKYTSIAIYQKDVAFT